jgi:hypothetical protein
VDKYAWKIVRGGFYVEAFCVDDFSVEDFPWMILCGQNCVDVFAWKIMRVTLFVEVNAWKEMHRFPRRIKPYLLEQLRKALSGQCCVELMINC